jgi:hypothetical protein
MVEKTITDGLENVITLKYDDVNDRITIKNTGVDDEFHLVYLNPDIDVIDNVVTILGINGSEQWEGFTDDFGRLEIIDFWETNKIDKTTRGIQYI